MFSILSSTSFPTLQNWIRTLPDGELPDISKCKSKWVTANKLKEWWSRVVADMATFKDGNDRSGQHDFSFEILEDLYESYGRGKKHMLYLSSVAIWRGCEALEFVSATLPDNCTRDGMGVDEEDDNGIPAIRRSATKSARGTATDDDPLRHLLADTLKGIGGSAESPRMKRRCM